MLACVLHPWTNSPYQGDRLQVPTVTIFKMNTQTLDHTDWVNIFEGESLRRATDQGVCDGEYCWRPSTTIDP